MTKINFFLKKRTFQNLLENYSFFFFGLFSSIYLSESQKVFSCLPAVMSEERFQRFFAEYMRTGGYPPQFDAKKVFDFKTFWKEFIRTGGYAYLTNSFDCSKVHDFESFVSEFLNTGGYSSSFDKKRL